MTPQQAIELVLGHQQAGRLTEAESACRRLLDEHPDHAAALNLAGVIALQLNQPDVAATYFRRAVAVNSQAPGYFSNLAAALLRLGRADEAAAASEKAIALNPDFAPAYENLAQALQAQNQLDRAIAMLRHAVAQRPDSPDLWNLLGRLLRASGDLNNSAHAYQQALKLRPHFPEALSNLGLTLQDQGKLPDAIAAQRQALEQRPDFPQAYINLGLALEAAGDRRAAMEVYIQATTLRPSHGDAWNNLGMLFREAGQFDEAIAAFSEGLKHSPDHAFLHINHAAALLLKGDFEAGWPEWEWRRRLPKSTRSERMFAQPEWTGGDLTGRRILLHTEQGYGDVFQFVRYVQLVHARGPKEVMILCPPDLKAVLQGIHPAPRIIADGEPLPEFDTHALLMSLPRLFGTTLSSIPAAVPYLKADPILSNQWRQRLAEIPGFKVGLCWSGKQIHADNRNRSIQVVALNQLSKPSSVTLISLQKGEAARQLNDAKDLMIKDWTNELHTFADTAALIDNLDMVITVDTSVAHLAGAMGKPTWVFLHSVPDWRWLLNRADSPWYPTMRLFRQTTPGDWRGPIQQAADLLQERLHGRV